MEMLSIALGAFLMLHEDRGAGRPSRRLRFALGAGLVGAGLVPLLDPPAALATALRLAAGALLVAGLVLAAREGWLARTFLPCRRPRSPG